MTAAALLALAAPAGAQVPPPPVPQTVPEFFNPTYVTHRADATCAGARLSLQWAYAQAGLSVGALTFQDAPASAAELARIDGWLKGLPGDALARIECGKAGAVIAFVDAARAGTPARVVKIAWVGGRAALVGRYRFD